MKLTLALALTIVNCTIGVVSFVLNRKDKAVKDTKEQGKENHQELIEYQLKELKDDVKAILSKLDRYETDIDDRVDKAIELHIKLYHSNKGE